MGINIKRGTFVDALAGIFFALLIVPGSAIAQSFSKLNDTLTNVVNVLQGAGVLIVTVAIVWAGYKMVFQHSKWADISTLVIGAVFIGGAASMAKWLMGALV